MLWWWPTPWRWSALRRLCPVWSVSPHSVPPRSSPLTLRMLWSSGSTRCVSLEKYTCEGYVWIIRCVLHDLLIAYLHLSSPVGDFQRLARTCLFMLAWRLLPAPSKENCINLRCSLWILCHNNPFFVLQVNLKMREITEKEHKSKQHLLESPSPQKVLDIPAQEFHTCIVKLSESWVLFRPGFSHLFIVNWVVSV